jgi:hypothetical protein
MTKSVVYVPGWSVVAIRPPVTPPRPIPRLVVTRCMAYAEWREARSARPAMRLEWLGQNAPVLMPDRAAATNACHGSRTSA